MSSRTAPHTLAPVYPRRGELWTVDLPDDPHAPRPCLIISENTRNQLSGSVLVVPIFTSAPDGPTHVTLRAGAGNVRHDSVLVCEDVTRIPLRFMRAGPLGRAVPVAVLKSVVRAVRIAIGDPTV